MTFGEAEKKFIQELVLIYDQDESKALAGLTLRHITRVSRGELLMKRNQELEPVAETSLMLILDELKSGKPLQYVLGETEFLGLRFLVNSSVLIPRPETEELVDWIIREVQSNVNYSSILDIGTGSGCIPVALKKKLPALRVSAIDISYEALETAMRNAVLNGTEITFKRVDILNPDSAFPGLKFSIIVSNPPYITEEEKGQMHQNVLEFEPHTALFVEDADPLLFYSKIADYALGHLEPGGLLFFEINEYLGEETVQLLRDKGFKTIELRKDLRGRNRMIKAGMT